MHTPESKRDAQLHDLGIDNNVLDELADLPVAALDIPLVGLDLPDFQDAKPLVTRGAKAAGISAPGAVSPRTVRITIRIPGSVLDGFKAHATSGNRGYQTLMVRALREWLAASERRGKSV
jgi:uncharacterized protein (DUF4415 family)